MSCVGLPAYRSRPFEFHIQGQAVFGLPFVDRLNRRSSKIDSASPELRFRRPWQHFARDRRILLASCFKSTLKIVDEVGPPQMRSIADHRADAIATRATGHDVGSGRQGGLYHEWLPR